MRDVASVKGALSAVFMFHSLYRAKSRDIAVHTPQVVKRKVRRPSTTSCEDKGQPSINLQVVKTKVSRLSTTSCEDKGQPSINHKL